MIPFWFELHVKVTVEFRIGVTITVFVKSIEMLAKILNRSSLTKFKRNIK